MKVEIRPMTNDEPEYVYKKVGEMFTDLYQIMGGTGLTFSLAKNGETIWLNSIKSSLGKLNMVFIAFDGDKIIGFISGNIRLSPAFEGNKKIGYASNLFIEQEYRKSKIGHLLFDKLEEWFREKQVDRMEAVALNNNKPGLNFCLKLGYKVDLIRMYKKND